MNCFFICMYWNFAYVKSKEMVQFFFTQRAIYIIFNFFFKKNDKICIVSWYTTWLCTCMQVEAAFICGGVKCQKSTKMNKCVIEEQGRCGQQMQMVHANQVTDPIHITFDGAHLCTTRSPTPRLLLSSPNPNLPRSFILLVPSWFRK